MFSQRRLTRRALLPVLVVGLALPACTDSTPTGANESTTTTSAEPATPFWPASVEDIAIVSDYRASDGTVRLAITDGERVVPLEDVGEPDSFAKRGHTLAFSSGYGGAEVGMIDLATGQITKATCASCSGIAVLDGRIVSIDTDFKMHVFDTSMSPQEVIQVEHVTEPQRDEPHDEAIPTVLGTLDGRVAVRYLTTNGIARGGPEIVSLYKLDGTLDQSWTVDGRIYGSQIDALGLRLVLAVGGSGGACASIAIPELIDPAQPAPIVLMPKAEQDRGDRSYFASDLWWNGDEIAAFGAFIGTLPDAPCSVDFDLRRFDLRGQLGATPTSGVSAYRLLGSGCDHALMVDSPGDTSQLYEISDGRRREVEGYDTILWTDTRSQKCTEFAGISD